MCLSWPLWYLSVFNVYFDSLFFASGWKDGECRKQCLSESPFQISSWGAVWHWWTIRYLVRIEWLSWSKKCQTCKENCDSGSTTGKTICFLWYIWNVVHWTEFQKETIKMWQELFFKDCSSQFNFSYFGAGWIFNFFLQFNMNSDFQVCFYLLNCTFGSICSFPDS